LWTEVSPFDRSADVEIESIACADDRVVLPAWSRRIASERLGIALAPRPARRDRVEGL
jgi:hypothetical protein